MCGIAGYLSHAPMDPGVLADMVQALFHRGPDEAGFHEHGPFHGGMRRLSINDLSHGRQPLFNGDDSVALLYNGEIYNHKDLRRDLSARGHTFRTEVDGEVICHLYDEVGLDLFEHLDGMFAVALWDSRRRRLVLARDLAGEKPLHYAPLPGGGIAFGSEIKALTRVPGLDLGLDRQALWDIPTFLWVPEPATVYRAIRALPRGHLLVLEDGQADLPSPRPYVNRFNDQRLSDESDAAIIEETRRVVTEAVESRLMADVPVGAFLSGGLDSSIISALTCRRLGPIDTFSVGFEAIADPYHGMADETHYAQRCAAHIGSRHHAIHVTAADFRAALPDFVHHGDQPFGVSSGLGVLTVCRVAREHGLKVLLSGDGADECFGGYSWYPHIAALTAASASRRTGNDAIVSMQNIGTPTERILTDMAAMTSAQQAWALHYYAHEDEKARLFASDFRDGLSSSLRHFDGLPHAPDRCDFIAHDRAFYFPYEMMRKADRMSMAASIEARLPFAAPAVLNHAAKLRDHHMVRGGVLKWALREAFRDILPMDIIDRPKHGFNVPIDHWLKTDWADLLEDTFSPGSALSRLGILAPGAAGVARDMIADPQRLNGHTLLCFIMINLWLERAPHGNHC